MNHYYELLQSLNAIVWEADVATGALTFVSRKAEAIMGYPLAEWFSRPRRWVEFVVPEHRALVESALDAAIASGERQEVRFQAVRADGEIIWLRADFVAPRNRKGKVRWLGGVMVDVTSAMQNAERLRLVEERHADILEIAPDAVISIDADHRIILFNRAAEEMFGYQAAEVMGQPLDLLLPDGLGCAHRRQVEAFIQSDVAVKRMGERRPIQGRRRNGELFPAEASISKLRVDGQVLLTAIVRDMTERVKLENALRYLADHDTLTGLPNRRRFQEELQARLERQEAGAVLLIDLDGFKEVNDTFGHPTGDALLAEVAGRLRACLRDGDLVARLGGDEFGAILPGAGETEAMDAAARLLDALRTRRAAIRGHVPAVTGSIGVALYPAHGETAEELMARADIALYRAKGGGCDQACLYAGQADGNAGLIGGETRLREALQQNRFRLYAQPIRHLETGRVTTYELLLRLQDSSGRLLLPSAFLGVAERFGLIHEIDRWVTEQAIALLAATGRGARHLSLSVNLSAGTLLDPELPDLLERRLAQSGVDPAALILEITERGRITDLDTARGFMARLKSLGCRFALDDFGVGYSSFQMAKELPVDILKIDGSFVRNLRANAQDRAVIRSMVYLARNLGLTTVAEFVEDEATEKLLHSLGVQFVQGYRIGKPAPADLVMMAAR